MEHKDYRITVENVYSEFRTMDAFFDETNFIGTVSERVYRPILHLQNQIGLYRGCEEVFQYAWAAIFNMGEAKHPEALLFGLIRDIKKEIDHYYEFETKRHMFRLVLTLLYALCIELDKELEQSRYAEMARLLANCNEVRDYKAYIDKELNGETAEVVEMAALPAEQVDVVEEKKERFKYINKSMSEEEQEEVEKKIQAWVKNEENGAAKVLANYFMREREQIAKDKELTLSGYETAKVLYDELAAHFKGCAFACSTWQRHYSARKK